MTEVSAEAVRAAQAMLDSVGMVIQKPGPRDPLPTDQVENILKLMLGNAAKHLSSPSPEPGQPTLCQFMPKAGDSLGASCSCGHVFAMHPRKGGCSICEIAVRNWRPKPGQNDALKESIERRLDGLVAVILNMEKRLTRDTVNDDIISEAVSENLPDWAWISALEMAADRYDITIDRKGLTLTANHFYRLIKDGPTVD